MIKQLVHRLGKAYIAKLTRNEVNAQKFTRHNERPIEYRFLFDCINDLRPVTVLDVGTGTTAVPSLIASCGCIARAIDNVHDYWPRGMQNRHWYIEDDDIRSPRMQGEFDLVTCISVIEHIEDHLGAFSSMARLVRPGGHLLLTLPYSEKRSVRNVYELPNAAYGQGLPYICRSTSREELSRWLAAGEMRIARQEYWQCWTGEVWTQGQMVTPPRLSSVAEPHQLSCLLLERATTPPRR